MFFVHDEYSSQRSGFQKRVPKNAIVANSAPNALLQPIIRLLIAWDKAALSLVGGWTHSAKPENATTPFFVVGLWAATNCNNVATNACVRVGWMLVVHMLFDQRNEIYAIK